MKVFKWRVFAQRPTNEIIAVAYSKVDEFNSKDFGIRFEGSNPHERYLTLTLYDIHEFCGVIN